MKTSLFGAVALMIALVVLSSHAQIIQPLEGWITNEFHGAVQSEKSGHISNFVIRPGKGPTENTTATYKNPSHTLSIGNGKTPAAPSKQPSVGFGISIDNPTN